MRTLPSIVVSAAVSLALAGSVGAQATDAEFKCMASASKATSKFWVSKNKCISKCFVRFWDGLVPESDCLAPYGGWTATCIANPPFEKGAEDKFAIAIRKGCDSTYRPGTQCPACYDGGDCSLSGYALDQVANIEGQVDSFAPGVVCERTDAFNLEQRCQLTTLRWIGKYVAYASKCYDRCFANARKGIVPAADCAPPADDGPTQECLAHAEAKAAYYMDHDCHAPPSIPDNCGSPYPTPSEWLGYALVAIEGDVPQTYCGYPSAAFVD